MATGSPHKGHAATPWAGTPYGVSSAGSGFTVQRNGKTPTTRAAQAMLRAASEGNLRRPAQPGSAPPLRQASSVIFKELDKLVDIAAEDDRERCADLAVKMMDVWKQIGDGEECVESLVGEKDATGAHASSPMKKGARPVSAIFVHLQDAVQSCGPSEKLADVALPPTKNPLAMMKDVKATKATKPTPNSPGSPASRELPADAASLDVTSSDTANVFQQLDACTGASNTDESDPSTLLLENHIASLRDQMEDLCHNIKETSESEGAVNDKHKYHAARASREHNTWLKNTLQTCALRGADKRYAGVKQSPGPRPRQQS